MRCGCSGCDSWLICATWIPGASDPSVKALRYYHDAGLLEPSEVDPDNGCRYYSEEQIGSLIDIDVTYIELGAYVMKHEISLDGPP